MNPIRRNRRLPNRGTNRQSTIIGSGSNASSTLQKLTKCVVPKSSLAFPDVYQAWFKTVVENGISGSAASQNTYHLNSPAFTFGPQTNWTGAFSNNYPAGLSYLLGTSQAGGSTGPYAFCSTLDYDWSVDLYNIGTVAAYVTLVPSWNISLTGMSQSTLAEQRGAAQILVPPTNNSNPMKLRVRGSIAELMATSPSFIRNDTLTYAQAVGALPLYSVYMHLIVGSVDGTTSCAMQVKNTIFQHLRLTRINPFTSAQPT